MLKIFNWCKTNADVNIIVIQDTDAFVFMVAAISKTLFTLTILAKCAQVSNNRLGTHTKAGYSVSSYNYL